MLFPNVVMPVVALNEAPTGSTPAVLAYGDVTFVVVVVAAVSGLVRSTLSGSRISFWSAVSVVVPRKLFRAAVSLAALAVESALAAVQELAVVLAAAPVASAAAFRPRELAASSR